MTQEGSAITVACLHELGGGLVEQHGLTWIAFTAVDGECFARASLAIGKDADVVAIHSRLDQMLGVFKHLHHRHMLVSRVSPRPPEH